LPALSIIIITVITEFHCSIFGIDNGNLKVFDLSVTNESNFMLEKPNILQIQWKPLNLITDNVINWLHDKLGKGPFTLFKARYGVD
jgi:hypothetical protein